MKSLVILESIVLVILLFLFFAYNPFSKLKTQMVKIINYKLTVEVADTEALRTRGLSGRANLAQDHGMLFIFPVPNYYRFWMKDMKFPLDFIWINKGKVVDLTENVPVPKTANEILPTFTAKYPFDKVIEVNAGIIRSLRLRIGDVIMN